MLLLFCPFQRSKHTKMSGHHELTPSEAFMSLLQPCTGCRNITAGKSQLLSTNKCGFPAGFRVPLCVQQAPECTCTCTAQPHSPMGSSCYSTARGRDPCPCTHILNHDSDSSSEEHSPFYTPCPYFFLLCDFFLLSHIPCLPSQAPVFHPLLAAVI